MGVSSTLPSLPFFKESEYEIWSIKIKILFISQDLWELLENGYNKTSVLAETLKESKKKEVKVLFFIQQNH